MCAHETEDRKQRRSQYSGNDSFDVITLAASPSVSNHFRSQRSVSTCTRHHSDFESSAGTDLISPRAATSGLSATVLEVLDETPLFYVALTSGASLAACVTGCTAWVVAIVAVTSLFSFAANSARNCVFSLTANNIVVIK